MRRPRESIVAEGQESHPTPEGAVVDSTVVFRCKLVCSVIVFTDIVARRTFMTEEEQDVLTVSDG